jgi:hypothetical protein
VHNLVDIDLVLPSPGITPPAGSIVKVGILLDDIDEDGFSAINNIVYMHVDPPFDDIPARVPLYERVDDITAGSGIEVMTDNLFFIEGDAFLTRLIYARLEEVSEPVLEYGYLELDDILGAGTALGSFVVEPMLLEPPAARDRTSTRLSPLSPAVDAVPVSADTPADDIDRERRPVGTAADIGPDEVTP